MYKSLLILLFALSLSAETAMSQELGKNDPKFELGLEGMLFSSVGKDFYAFNVGGPSLLLRITDDLKAGFAAMPSFYVREGKSGAKLAVGPRLDYKNFVFAIPFFHFDTSETWIMTAGIGYKFHRKN